MSLKKNVVANYFGQGWQALMALVFVPVYIKYLGIEAYGLIGIFAMLQAWLTLLDMGMKPALGREMARFTGGAHKAQSIRDLLRSIELIGLGTAGGVAIAIWAGSGWMAAHWVTAKSLPPGTVAHAFALMGVVTALRFIENIYVSSVVGLQLQLLQNTVTSISATVRGLGAVALLAWVSPTVGAFFLWQTLISTTTVVVFATVVYRVLPTAPRPAHFSRSELINIWRFAAGMVAITFLALLLNQVDKILLSRLLSLEVFGYYALAGTVANALYIFLAPITAALYPRFTKLATNGDNDALNTLYHQGAQLVTVLMGSATIVLILFRDRVIRLWTGDPALTQHVAPLMAVLALGTLLNGLMTIPYLIQLAHGWTSLTVKINIIAVSLLVPAILLVVPAHGAGAAAWGSVIVNAGYLLFSIPIMHRRLLRTEKWRWYREDVAVPLAAAAATAFLCRSAMPHALGKLGEFIVLLSTASCVLVAAALAATRVRQQLVQYLSGRSLTLRSKSTPRIDPARMFCP